MKKNIILLLIIIFVICVITSPLFAQEKKEEVIELEFPSWQWSETGYRDWFQLAADEFTKANPGIRIKATTIPSGANYNEYMIIRYEANDIPEINHVQGARFHQFYKAGYLESLDGYPGFKELKSKFLENFWDFSVVDGQQFFIPMSTYSKLLFYNKEMFDEAGVSYPETWNSLDDLVIAAKKLTKTKESGEKQYGYSCASSGDRIYLYGWLPLVLCQGVNITTNGVPTATSPEVIKAISVLRDLIVSGATAPGINSTQMRQLFWEEKAAMLYDGPWVYSTIKELNPNMISYLGLAGLPGFQATGISNGFSIIKNQKYKDEAWKFIMFMNSERMVKAYSEMTGLILPQNIPITEKAIENFPSLIKVQEYMPEGIDSNPVGMEEYVGAITNIVYPILEEVFYSGLTPEAGAEQIQKELEELNKN